MTITLKTLEARIQALEAAMRMVSPAAARRFLDGITPQPRPIAQPAKSPKIRVDDAEVRPEGVTAEGQALVEGQLSGRIKIKPTSPLF